MLNSNVCYISVFKGPSSKKLLPNIRKLDGCFSVQFNPTEVGPHQIDVLLDRVQLNGCPFSCNIYDVSRIKVGGLGQGSVGKPITFQGTILVYKKRERRDSHVHDVS